MKTTYSEPNNYLGRPGKGLIASMSLKGIRRLKKSKNEKLGMSEVSLEDLSKITEEVKDVPYEYYVRKMPKHIPTESCLYL